MRTKPRNSDTGLISKLATLFSIFNVYKYLALVLLIVMMAAALSESLGLGMVMPFLEIVIKKGGGSDNSLKYLYPVFKYFPEHYRLMIVIILLGLFMLLKNVLDILKIWLSFKFIFRYRELWMSKIMKKYMHAEYLSLISQKQGTLLNNLLTEPAIASKSLQQIIGFLSSCIQSVFLYGLIFFINWRITLIITITAAVVIFLTRKITYNYSLGVGRKRLALSQELNSIGAENINAIRQIKIFSLENQVSAKFSRKLNDLMRMLLKFRVINNIPMLVTESIMITGFVIVLLYLQYISQTSLSSIIPTLTLFLLISRRFFPIIANLYAERMDILTYYPSMKLVYNLYKFDEDFEELDKGGNIDRIAGDIVFDCVSFSYSSANPVFEKLCLEIPKGKITAIVGPSGAGKSTIVDLLSGFLKSYEGKILVNGINLKDVSLLSWRKLVGYISQDTVLFNASVKDNILVGKPGASEGEIIIAAEKALADEFIKKLPMKYDTIIGERGLMISGGERQRIAIARALIRDPELLIFDEATSALDQESERLIQKSINGLVGEKTIIIIAHRLTTVKNAFRIIVLDKGKIVETGVHDELIKAEGVYWRLAQGSLANK
ncbi:MAG: hypothetical protein A2Y66_03215 [Nitrospirae bacterium RBG_13_41_22]|nr:MAG: hypothetical protein A2Y66_03215 [Nitrospirae bacterium RBG_13_41_22]